MRRYAKYKDSGIPWIGEVPETWKVMRLMGIANTFFKGNGITREDVFEDGDSPCVRYGDIYTKYDISFSCCKTRTNKARLSSCTYIHHGDIVFALTGELVEEIGKSVVYLGDDRCIVGGDIAVLRHSQNPGFLGYYLASSVAQQQKSFGKAKLKVVHTKIGDLKNIVVSLPSADEQRAIVEYLDSAVGKIDSYIAGKETEIEKLGLLKQSVIAHAVTQGINPNAKMKDSGIPWICQVPETWKKQRIKTLFSLRDERNYESLENVNLISVYTNIGVIQHSDIEETTGNKAVSADGYKKVYKNDIVVNIILCWMGALGKSNFDGVTSPAYDVYKPKDNVNCDYFHYLFRTTWFNGECLRRGRGIMMMRWRTYSKEFTSITVPIPPANEQRSIVEFIDGKVREIDGFISAVREQIEKLKLYKQRLISDVVTGKIKVGQAEDYE